MRGLNHIKAFISNEKKGPELPAIPGDEQVFEWNGQEIVYSVMGEGKPLLLLHGANASAWRFEVRRNIEPLAKGGYRVYAPDMPGFGKSTRLAKAYTASEYISFIKDFVTEINKHDGQPVTVVAGTLCAAHTIGAAAQNPELFNSLLLICPTGIKHLGNVPSTRQKDLFKKFSGKFGATLFWLLTTRPSTRIFLKRDAYYDKNYITKDIVEGYHRSARYPYAQYAPFSFITTLLSYNVEQEWPNLKLPVAIVWGDKSKTLPLSDMEDFLRLRPKTEHYVVTNSRLAINDERAEEFNELALRVLEEMQQTKALQEVEGVSVS